MITREQIRKLAGYSYSRGVDIWRQGKIRRFQIKTTKKGRQIQADVKGSGRNLYDVRILLDEEEDSVQEAWCDCPAFYSYEGLCKHCTAVLLYYLENPDRVEEEHMSLSEYLKQRGLEGIQKEIGEATDGIKIQENLRSPGNTTASGSEHASCRCFEAEDDQTVKRAPAETDCPAYASGSAGRKLWEGASGATSYL